MGGLVGVLGSDEQSMSAARGEIAVDQHAPPGTAHPHRRIASSRLPPSVIGSWDMPDIEFIRAEIERTRLQVLRHRNEIMQLQRDGIPTTSAQALLDRMLNKIDDLRDERDRLRRGQHPHRKRGRRW